MSIPFRFEVVAAAAAAATLASCVHIVPGGALQAGRSQRADVIASQGQPTRVWPEPDGGSTLEYATQPFGTSCFMFRVDAAGTLREFHDALQPAWRARVEVGLTPSEVTRLLGQERRREFFRSSGEEVWDWTVEPIASSDGLRFNVHFKDGRVLRVSQSLVLRGKGGRHD